MRLTVALLLILVVAACGPTPVTPSPTAREPASVLSSITVDCGPFAVDVPDCLAIVSAAAKVAPSSLAAGTHAVVSKRVAGSECLAAASASCAVLAAAAFIAHVTFTDPDRKQASADVITNPLGAYLGINPTYGP